MFSAKPVLLTDLCAGSAMMVKSGPSLSVCVQLIGDREQFLIGYFPEFSFQILSFRLRTESKGAYQQTNVKEKHCVKCTL